MTRIWMTRVLQNRLGNLTVTRGSTRTGLSIWLLLSWFALGCHAARPSASPPVTPGAVPGFAVGEQPFCFAGTNNYYLHYSSAAVVDALLDDAQALGLKVVRSWAFLDRGSLDGSVRNVHGEGSKNGVHFQAWDPVKRRPQFEDSAEHGLGRLDYLLHAARERGLRVMLVLTNNWKEFGGMDQYLAWYGLETHADFYRDPRVRRAYKDWVHHLLTRVNALDGTLYREDPAIFAWELANEPRCTSGALFAPRGDCTTSTLVDWAGEMSEYVHSLAPQHLIAVGDEGFFAGQDGFGWDGAQGVDHVALTSLPRVSFGTFHLYPDHFGTSERWAERWVAAQLESARKLGKPTLLEEYGIKVVQDHQGAIHSGWARRAQFYPALNRQLLEGGAPGSLVWMLAGPRDDGTPYPDYDHFTFHRGDATSRLLAPWVQRFNAAPNCGAAAESVTRPTRGLVSVRPVAR